MTIEESDRVVNLEFLVVSLSNDWKKEVQLCNKQRSRRGQASGPKAGIFTDSASCTKQGSSAFYG